MTDIILKNIKKKQNIFKKQNVLTILPLKTFVFSERFINKPLRIKITIKIKREFLTPFL